MSESYIEVEEGTGKRLRTTTRTVGANQVHEEIVALVDVPSGTILSTTIPTVALPVRLTDGTNFYTASGGATSTVTVSNTVEVTATDLDIRDITETIPVNVVDISHTCTWASTFGTEGTTTVWDPSGSQVRIKYVSYSNRTGVSGRVNLEYAPGDEILPITLGSLGIFASNIVSGNVQGDTLSMVIDTAAMTVDVFVIGEEV